MKKYAVLIFVFLLILSVNGNATETFSLDLELFGISLYIVPFDLEFLDETLSVEELYNNINSITSGPELKQGWRAVPEPITMLLLGFGLVGLAGFGRKKFKK